jgi:predicted FMN-binding regulatory protein PaiB
MPEALCRCASEQDWLEEHLSHLTDQQEPTRNSTWQMQDAPQECTATDVACFMWF